jgi:hypothetical protein
VSPAARSRPFSAQRTDAKVISTAIEMIGNCGPQAGATQVAFRGGGTNSFLAQIESFSMSPGGLEVRWL